MPKSVFLGEFEQLVMLAILKAGDEAPALALREELNRIAGRKVSRGSLYRTLERLEAKGYISYTVEENDPTRKGFPRRIFATTQQGKEVLKAARQTLLKLWDGLEGVLE